MSEDYMGGTERGNNGTGQGNRPKKGRQAIYKMPLVWANGKVFAQGGA